jgi:hypothetical protein
MGVKQKTLRDAGCLVFFGLPFAIVGAALMLMALFGAKGTLFLFGTPFAVVGGSVVAWGLFSLRAGREFSTLVEAHPDEPWRWRKDWNQGLVSDNPGFALVVGVILTAIVDFLGILTVVGVLNKVREGEYGVLFALATFPLGGAILTYRVAKFAWRQWTTTPASFRMDQVPGVIGGKLKGKVLMPSLPFPAGDTRIILECLSRRLSKDSNTSTDKECVWWRTETVVPQSDPVWQEGAVDIPVAFDIPEDQSPTTPWYQEDENHAVRWRVRVETPLEGPDFRAEFDVPVFRTPASPPSPDEAVFRVTPAEAVLPGEAAPYTPDPGAALPPAAPAPDPANAGRTLRDAGFQTRPGHRGGIALVFPPGRQSETVIVAFMLLGGFLISVPVVMSLFIPKELALVGLVGNGAFGLGLIYSALLLWRGTNIIEVCDRGVGANASFTGRPPKRWTPFHDIMGLRIEGEEGRDRRPRCAVTLVSREERKRHLVGCLYHHEARAVLDALETAIRDYGGGLPGGE